MEDGRDPAGAGSCQSCGTALRPAARFCDHCGAPISRGQAEYKQVTVLFADVVGSMDIAGAVGAERLREIMAELVDRAATVVQRYGGTIDKFTGDGVMALFGAPVALEDHARRACLAALDLQRAAAALAGELSARDGINLRLRVGLNSGEVITGDIGAGPQSYTAIGEQVGMAQRMESVAAPGAVMLSESTARLVDDIVELGEQALVRIKGFAEPVLCWPLLSAGDSGIRSQRALTTLVGRDWEVTAIAGLMDQSISGKGRVVGLVGSPGIGKSRLVAETAKLAADRGVDVFTTYCESHTSSVPFHVAARLLREVFGVRDLDDATAREVVRGRLSQAGGDDLLLLHDLLDIADPAVTLPDIDPDARRRRLAAMLNTAAAARSSPTLYVIEDAHWIDPVSESMIAEFGAVVSQAHAMMLVSYRPEYRGALDRLPGAQRISLAPLDDSDSASIAVELLGSDESVSALATQVGARAAGNPFFAEEIVRDLAERRVITGARGHYVCPHDSAAVRVPATLQAAIAARIDRLGRAAKHTLYAAAVLGIRFRAELLEAIVDDIAISEVIDAELIDQVMFSPRVEYAFRHPLIRTVAYESQLKSTRAQLHRSLVEALREQGGESDANAALIAGHLEAAGELAAAYDWHMRAAAAASSRDVGAARVSWQRAGQVADRLPADHEHREMLRIVPRTLFCGNAWREWADGDDPVFGELRELADAAGDRVSVALALAGQITALVLKDRFAEAARRGVELGELVDAIEEPMLTVELLVAAANARFHAGMLTDTLRFAQRVIDLTDGDPTAGRLVLGSPLSSALALRGASRWGLGIDGWQQDLDDGVRIAHAIDRTSHGTAIMYKYAFPGHNGALAPDAGAIRETVAAVEDVGQSSDDLAFRAVKLSHGVMLARQQDPTQRRHGIQSLIQYRQDVLGRRPWITWLRIVDTEISRERIRTGRTDEAIALSRKDVESYCATGEMVTRGPAFAVLVEALLTRRTASDIAEAAAVIEQLAATPVVDGFVLHELPLLQMRARLADATGDEFGYGQLVRQYARRADELGFAEHRDIAAAMMR